jgi:arylsulfatase A-like enzyme
VTSAPPVYSKDETPAAFLTGEFVRWLGEQERDTPWFAHLSFLSPHPPFIVPEPYNKMYDPADGTTFRRAANWQAEAQSHPYLAYELGQQQRANFRPGAEGKVRDWGDDNFRRIRALYYGMISEVDAQLGRIWQAVKAAGAGMTPSSCSPPIMPR